MLKQNIICREFLCVDLTLMGENDKGFALIKEVTIRVGRVHAWQLSHALLFAMRSLTVWLSTGGHSFTRNLWYVLFGLHIPTSIQKQCEAYSLQGSHTHLNAAIWVVGLIALGLGLLIGGLLYSNFGLLPIVLLTSIILVAVSLPILLRSVSVLSKHSQVSSH